MFSNINVKLNVRANRQGYVKNMWKKRKTNTYASNTLKKEIFVSIVCEIERTYIVCADYILPHLDEPRRIRLIGPSV